MKNKKDKPIKYIYEPNPQSKEWALTILTKDFLDRYEKIKKDFIKQLGD